MLIVPHPAIGTLISGIIQCGALMDQGTGEYPSNRLIQILNLLIVQCVRCAQGVEPGAEECFVGVDVAQTRQEPLVKQQGFQPPSSPGDADSELMEGEPLVQWLWPQMAQHLIRVSHQVGPAQLSHIPKSQLTSIIQQESGVNMSVAGLRAGEDWEMAAHHKVDDQCVAAGKGK